MKFKDITIYSLIAIIMLTLIVMPISANDKMVNDDADDKTIGTGSDWTTTQINFNSGAGFYDNFNFDSYDSGRWYDAPQSLDSPSSGAIYHFFGFTENGGTQDLTGVYSLIAYYKDGWVAPQTNGISYYHAIMWDYDGTNVSDIQLGSLCSTNAEITEEFIVPAWRKSAGQTPAFGIYIVRTETSTWSGTADAIYHYPDWGYHTLGTSSVIAIDHSHTAAYIEREFRINIKNLAGQNLEGMPVDVSKNDMSGSSVGYTDVNGNYNDTLQVYSNTSTHVSVASHGIYDSIDWDFNFDGTPYSISLTAFQASPSGTYRNITYHVQNIQGYPIDNAWITHIISSSAQMSEYTDIKGNATFINVPVVSDMANYQTYKEGYQQSYGVFQFTGNMEKVITLYTTSQATPSATPTPIITQIPYNAWSLQASPNAIALGDSAVLVASNTNSTKETAAGGLRNVFYYQKDIVGAGYTLKGHYRNNVTNPLDWDFQASNSAPWQVNVLYDPMLLTVTPVTGGNIQYQVATFDLNGYSMGIANGVLNVAGGSAQGSLTMQLGAQDTATGAHISNVQMNITDEATGTKTEFGTVATYYSMSLGRGGSYTLRASKDGYEDGEVNFIVPMDTAIIEGSYGAMQNVNMYPEGMLPSAGNCSVTVRVTDAETYYPIGNVQVAITGTGLVISPRLTSIEGDNAFFILPQNTAYTITATKEGYCKVSESKNTGALTSQFTNIFMKYGSCIGVTPTHTPIPNATPITTIPTPIGGYGNLNGTVTTCNRTAIYNGDIAEFIKNQIACFGIKDLLSQNLALACIIMMLLGLIGASKAKAIGFMAGAGIGSIISMAMGLLPFWILIALVVIFGIIVGAKVFGAGGG